MQITLPMVTAVAKQPRLWTTALKAYRSLVPEKWWTRRPFLPVPDADWMHFRLETAYGGDGTPADSAGEELTTWLNWLKD
ncbi:MAG: hypothetical protein ACN4GZ_10100 [Acidimicrobiales bacterium]